MAIASCTISASEPLGTTSDDALECNSSTLDLLVNGTETVTSRTGKQLLSVSQLEQNFIMTAVNGGVWASGQTFTAFNQFMVFNTTAYKSKITSTLPLTVGSTPDLNFVEPFDLSSGIGIRQSKLDNPLLHILKKNKLVDTLAGVLIWNRSTIATYIDRYGVLRTATTNTPREETKGWLREGSDTNLLLHSEEFDNIIWSKADINVIANDNVAPDLTVTADKIIPTGTSSKFLNQDVSVTSGLDYTLSFFIEKDELPFIQITGSAGFPTSFVNFNLTTGEVGNNDVSNFNIENIRDDIYRVSLTLTATSTTVGRFLIVPLEIDNNTRLPTFTPNGTDGLHIWGADFEQLSFASSYKPTSASTFTRAADLPSVQVDSNFISPTEGDHSQFMRFSLLGDTGAGQRLYTALAIGGSNSRYTSTVDNTSDTVRYFDGELGSSTSTSNVSTALGTISLATVTDNNLRKVYFNGTLEDSDINTVTDLLDTTVSLDIGHTASQAPMYGHITDFRIYDFALNDREVDFLSG